MDNEVIGNTPYCKSAVQSVIFTATQTNRPIESRYLERSGQFLHVHDKEMWVSPEFVLSLSLVYE